MESRLRPRTFPLTLVLAASLLCSLLCVSLSAPAAAQTIPPAVSTAAVHVAYRTSHMLGLVLFATTIAEFPNRPAALREAFRGSRYDTPETRRLLQDFRALHQRMQEGIDFQDYPPGRPHGVKLEQLLFWRALDARNLDELRAATQGMLPLADQERYFTILREIQAIYDPLIWEQNLGKLESYRAEMEARTQAWGVDAMFRAAARFYRSAWPAGLPFTVALYPVPGGKGSTTAESFGSLETVAVLVDEKDLAGRFGVIFHEMCHSLFEAEPVASQQELAGWFDQDSSAYAPLAYAMLNEAVATAIGNGWAYERATGHRDGSSWYADPVIDGFAKALYPEVARRLDAGLPIDRDFVTHSIETFARAFPDAPYRVDLLLREIVLMTDGETFSPAEARDVLRARFRMSSIYSTAPIDDDRSLAYLDQQPKTPVVIAVAPGSVGQLAALEARLPSLASRIAEAARAPGDVLLAGFEGRRAVLLFKVRDPGRLARAADALRDLERIDPAAGNRIEIE
ncbi:MAG: hypothetical protein QUU85_01465 [Candidatus Eisenbacteria bacterium]|nr:hypothetical protein [Candidatus Eisenbacteria bacterium]